MIPLHPKATVIANHNPPNSLLSSIQNTYEFVFYSQETKMNVLLLVTLVTAALGQHSENKVTIQKIDHIPGIYFERMLDIRFEVAEWKVLVFIDHRSFQYKPGPMRKIMDETKAICSDLQSSSSTKYFCRIFQERLKLLETRIDHLNSIHGEIIDTMEEVETMETTDTAQISTIQKRSAPLGFLGSLSHVLFGTLTEEEGKYYTEKINELFKGEVRLAHLAKKNMHIVHQKLQNFEDRINKQEKEISSAIDNLKKVKDLNNLESVWQFTGFEIKFTAITNGIESALNLYEVNFQTLLEITRAARIHKLHPSLLPLNKLQQIIRNIEDLHPNNRFPIPLKHARSDKLSTIASVKLAFRDEKFLVEITFPLTDKVSTELYKMHPVPIPQEQENHTSSAFILPHTTYISIGHDKRTYAFLSQDQWANCKETPHFKLCPNTIPIFDANENSTCEYLLLNNPTINNLKRCEIRILPNHKPFVKHLDTLQAWLLSLNEDHNILINCPGELHHIIKFSGIGILY